MWQFSREYPRQMGHKSKWEIQFNSMQLVEQTPNSSLIIVESEKETTRLPSKTNQTRCKGELPE